MAFIKHAICHGWQLSVSGYEFCPARLQRIGVCEGMRSFVECFDFFDFPVCISEYSLSRLDPPLILDGQPAQKIWREGGGLILLLEALYEAIALINEAAECFCVLFMQGIFYFQAQIIQGFYVV